MGNLSVVLMLEVASRSIYSGATAILFLSLSFGKDESCKVIYFP